MGTDKNKTTPFIEERNKRFKLISDQGLWKELTESITINGKPIADRTAKDAFKVESFSDLKGPKLRVWLKSKELISKYEDNLNQYADE